MNVGNAIENNKKGDYEGGTEMQKNDGKENTLGGTPMSNHSLDRGCNLDSESPIISMNVNISKRMLEDTLAKEIGDIPFTVHLKEIDPRKELSKFDENEQLQIEPLINKIIGFAKDETYVTVVPVVSIEKRYLSEEIDDINYMVTRKPQVKLNQDKIKSPLIIKGYGYIGHTKTDLYVDIQALIAETLINSLKGFVNKDELSTKWSIGMNFNGEDAYTVSLVNRLFTKA